MTDARRLAALCYMLSLSLSLSLSLCSAKIEKLRKITQEKLTKIKTLVFASQGFGEYYLDLDG
jgi:hypothetical protein